MKGRKPLPTKIIELRGGTKYSHRPPRSNEPKPKLGLPPCPRHLNTEARKEWKRMSRELHDLGLLTKLDKTVFAMYCTSWATWKDACGKLATMSMIMPKKSTKTEIIAPDGTKTNKQTVGAPMINPYFRIQQEAQIQMMKCLVEMGMSPSSRSRIKVDMPKEKSKAQEFKDKKNGQKAS